MEIRFPEDSRFPGWKITFLQYLMAAAVAGLLIGYWRLQIGQHTYYAKQAERNRIRSLPIIAPRGRVLDRNGRVLVDNTAAFTVLLLRDRLNALDPAHLEGMARALELDPRDIRDLVKHSARLPRFQPLVLKQGATFGDAAFIEAHQLDYPELAVIQSPQRRYPENAIASQVLGHDGEVSEEEIAQPNSPYVPGDIAGKSGIEKEYDSILRGKDGMRRMVVNSRGQEMGELSSIEAVPGRELRLTLDLNLQAAAENALGSQSGAVVALDPENGQVLAMVSHPDYDADLFARHIDPKIWKKLTTNPQKPLMNKAIQAQLAPGSVFKIITAAAALETGTIKPSFTVNCPGEVTIYGHTFHDWTWWVHQPGHGEVNLHRAIVVSCDVYFFTLGKMLGIDNLDYFAHHLGLGQRTGIDLPGEDPGLVPSPGWVERVFRHRWWPGETIPVAIGQGSLMVTPLQLAYAIGGIASGGIFHRPRLVFIKELDAMGVDPPSKLDRDFVLKDGTVAAITRSLWGVVNEGGGTGAGARCPGVDIGGKTGTAQVASSAREESEPEKLKDNAWFVGVSPSRDPKIAVAVLVMGGGHSYAATPIAKQVIEAYYIEHGGLPASVENQLQAQLTAAKGRNEARLRVAKPPNE